MIKKSLILSVFSLALFVAVRSNAQQPPAISGITTSDLEHGSVRIYFKIVPDAYVRILFDTVSRASTGVYRYNTSLYKTGQITSPPSSIQDTTFGAFSLGALKPNTTYYFVVTASPNVNNTSLVKSSERSFTTPSDPGHPVLPVSPTVYNPSQPNLTGYTVVSMVSGASECVTAQAVSAPAGNTSWSGNVTAGMTVQQVLNNVGYGTILDFAQGINCKVPDTNIYQGGYFLTPKPLDPQVTSIGDPNHRWIIIQTHQNAVTDFPPVGVRTSASWDAKEATFEAQIPTSTVWVIGQHFTYALPGGGTPSVSPGNVHHFWIRNVRLTAKSSASGIFGAHLAFGGNCTDISAQATPPKYNVVEQVHMIGTSGTARSKVAIQGCPEYVALRNNSIEGFDAPGSPESPSQGIYFSDYGQGGYFIDNNFIQGIGQGIYFEANGGTIANHNDVVVSHNYLNWPAHTLAGDPTFDGIPRAFRNQFETKRSRRLLLSGNIIDGQYSYQNEGSAIFLSGNNDIYTGETGFTDAAIDSNIIRRAANVFNCWATRGSSYNHPPDNSVGRRVLFTNNLAYDLGRYRYNYLGQEKSLLSGYIETAPGCQDLVVRQNTFGFTNADGNGPDGLPAYYIPAILTVGSGAQLSEGFYFQNNIAYFSVPYPYARAGILNNQDEVNASFPRIPVVPGNAAASQVGILNAAMVQLDGSAQGTPNAVWSGNVMVGGTIDSGAEPWPDLSQAQVTNYSSGPGGTMPSGDTYTTGSTMADRTQSAGLLHTANNDYTCTPTPENPANAQGQCSAGANVAQIYNAAGVVTALTVTPSSSGATVTYKAPDARVCSVDYGVGTSFTTRLTDAGGATSRTITLSGLQPSTTYSYRLLCYFEQGPSANVPDGVATTGVFTTSPQPPTAFTTYLNTYGSAPLVYSGATQVLHERVYNPGAGGASALQTVWLYLKPTAASNPDYTFQVTYSGGVYSFYIVNSILSQAAPWPYLTLTPDGTTHSVNVTTGPVQLTSYRLALNGNELQLDLGITHSGTFDSQITLGASIGATYSTPWVWTSAGEWKAP